MLEEYAKIKNGARDLNQTVRIQKQKSLAQHTAEFAKVLLYELQYLQIHDYIFYLL